MTLNGITKYHAPEINLFFGNCFHMTKTKQNKTSYNRTWVVKQKFCKPW